MPGGGTKREAAPVPPKSALKKRVVGKAKGGKKRNVRERDNTDCGSEVCESEWHSCIQRNDWKSLQELLNLLKGDALRTSENGRKSKKGSILKIIPSKSPKKIGSSISWLWKGSGASPSEGKEKAVQALDGNSLLVTNSAGRTPLHCALDEEKIPDSLILELLTTQPKAVSLPDGKGRLPLHFAVVRRKKIDLMSELVELYPRAMSHEDTKGKTPLAYAMDVAKRQTVLDDAPSTFWATEQEESSAGNWQERQIQLWEVVRWLLLSSASHRETQLTMEPLLIEALVHAAPPTVISLLIAASSALLGSGEQGTSLCCSAMYLCIFRQYPLFVLRRLGFFCPADVRFVRDETGLGLVSAHYVTSCFEKSQLMEYRAAEDFMATIETCIIEGELVSDNLNFLEWWTKLKYLMFFCAEKDPDYTSEDYLLHAALINTDTPPNVIRLLLALYPDSARQVDPNSAHPLHLYCMHREYIPRNYESPYMHGLNVMEMLLSLDESAAFHRYNDRLPLHLAIATGRGWSTLHPLVSSYRSSLRKPDPVTRLYPAMLAATYQETPDVEKMRLLQLTRNQYSSIVWRGLSEKQQQNAVARMKQSESLMRLSTIFELLRRYPQCLEGAITTGEETYNNSDLAGAGVIATHYLSWCYKKVNGKWEINHENMDVLKTNIRMVDEFGVLGKRTKAFVDWMTMLKVYIWHSYNAAASLGTEDELVHTIPRDDDFLLHAAVSNADTPLDVVQLLVGLYPRSSFMALPDTQTLPLHLSCKTPSYIPRHFEVTSRHSAVELLVHASPEAVLMRCDDGRMPLHVAIDAGKTMEELQPLISQGPQAVTVCDPIKRLYPFQMMALPRELSAGELLRFKDIARNKHAEAWSQLTEEEQESAIHSVHNEHKLAVLSSIFGLLHLNVSVLDTPIPSKGGTEAGEIVIETPLYVDERWASYHVRPKKKQTRLRRLLSGLSGDSMRDGLRSDASAFSSIDMVSTISNVSSHISFRGRHRGVGADSGKMGLSGTGEDAESESEDSDIYSEEASFVGEDDLSDNGLNDDNNYENGEDGDWGSDYANAPPRASSENQKGLPTKENSPPSVPESSSMTQGLEGPDVPQETPIPSESTDDVSHVERSKNPKSTIGNHIRPKSLLEDLTSDSGESKEEFAPCNSSHPGKNAALARNPGKQEPSSDSLSAKKEGLQLGSAHSVTGSSSNDQYAVALPSADDFDDSIQITEVLERARVSKSDNSDDDGDDGSIQDELVNVREAEKLVKSEEEEEEEPVVYFRLRRSSYRKPGGMKLRRKKRTTVPHNDSSLEMDFLSILHASLPEGGMDYLSTLEASSGSLPPGHDSLPTGRFDRMREMKDDRMQQIKEFPSESEHGTNLAIGYSGKHLERKCDRTELPPHMPSSTSASMDVGHYQEQHNSYGGLSSSNGAQGTGLIQWQRNVSSRNAPIESKPSNFNEGQSSCLIQWRRNKYDRKQPMVAMPPSSSRGVSQIQWRRNKIVPKGPIGPPNSRGRKGTFQIEWRRNKHTPKGPSSAANGNGSVDSGTRNSKAPQSLLSALEARRNSLEISRKTSSYIGVQPQRLKSCLQCGLRERGVLMLPCTHLCLCRECSEDIDQVTSCPICMNPVIDTMVVL